MILALILLVTLMASLWNPSPTAEKKWTIVNPFPAYQKIYDKTQANLEKLSGLDELLSGVVI